MPLFSRGVKTVAKEGSSKIQGNVTFSEGANVTITQVGKDIEIAAAGDAANVASVGKTGDPIQGVVTVSEGSNITITRSGQDLQIAASINEPDVNSIGKSGDPIQGDVIVAEGSNITITRSGQTLTFDASGGTAGVTAFGESGAAGLTGNVTISEGSNITLTPSGNNISIAASTDPAVLTDISDLQVADQYLDGRINNVGGAYGSSGSSDITPTTLNSSTTSLTSNVATVVLNNTSTYRNMAVMYTVVARIYGNTDNANTNRLQMNFDLQTNVNGGGYTTPVNLNEYIYMDSDGTEAKDLQRVWTGTALVAPGVGFTIDSRMVLTWTGTGAAAYIVDNCIVEISAIGVPLI